MPPSLVSSMTPQQIFWEGSLSAFWDGIEPGPKCSDDWYLTVVKCLQYKLYLWRSRRYHRITESIVSFDCPSPKQHLQLIKDGLLESYGENVNTVEDSNRPTSTELL